MKSYNDFNYAEKKVTSSKFKFTSLLVLSLILKVILEDSQSTAFLTELSYNTARSSYSLLDGTIIIELGESTHGSKVLSIIHHNDRNFSFGTKGTDELFVLFVLTVLGEAAETGRAAVKCLGALVESLAETIVDKGLLQDLYGWRGKCNKGDESY